MRVENLCSVYARVGDALTKAGDFADFLKIKHFAGSIAIDTDAGRIVTTVFLAGETVTEDVADFLASLWGTETKSVYQLLLIGVMRRIIGGIALVRVRDHRAFKKGKEER